MEEPVVDPALAAAPAEIPIAKAESVAREVGQAIPFWERFWKPHRSLDSTCA